MFFLALCSLFFCSAGFLARCCRRTVGSVSRRLDMGLVTFNVGVGPTGLRVTFSFQLQLFQVSGRSKGTENGANCYKITTQNIHSRTRVGAWFLCSFDLILFYFYIFLICRSFYAPTPKTEKRSGRILCIWDFLVKKILTRRTNHNTEKLKKTYITRNAPLWVFRKGGKSELSTPGSVFSVQAIRLQFWFDYSRIVALNVAATAR